MNFKVAEKSQPYNDVFKDNSFDFAIRIIKHYQYFNKTENWLKLFKESEIISSKET